MPNRQNGNWNDEQTDFAPDSIYTPVVHHRSYEKPAPTLRPEPKPRKREKPWKAFMYAAVIIINLCGIALLAILMIPQLTGYFWSDFDNYAFMNGECIRYDKSIVASYKQCRSYMNQDVIYPGIFVNGVHVGGMTKAEALEALGGEKPALTDAFSLTISIGDKEWKANNDNIPAYRNNVGILEQAYAIGRTNTSDIQASNETPFAQRTANAMALREEGVNLTTHSYYDHSAVRTLANGIATYINRDPVNAEIASFDFKTRTFGFTQSSPGVSIDGDKLYDDITAMLDRWEMDMLLHEETTVIQPDITTEDLQANFKMVSAYTTSTTKDENRNNNINLASLAINGTVLLPGETFSFNKATGERTPDKGYKEAGAISKGESIEEVGGGVCQVSSTLFNAAARADLEIVKRYPHAWPSKYVNKGEDATVNWPDLDFQFKNNKNSPIFIIMYYKNRKVSAEIWGYSLGDGVTIELESIVTKTLNPPSEAEYIYNPSLPQGTSKTTVQERTGYVVDTYKVWCQNGKEYKREKLHTSTYKAYQQVIQYND